MNKLAVSEAERKDQEESKQDQPIVFGMSFLWCCLFTSFACEIDVSIVWSWSEPVKLMTVKKEADKL